MDGSLEKIVRRVKIDSPRLRNFNCDFVTVLKEQIIFLQTVHNLVSFLCNKKEKEEKGGRRNGGVHVHQNLLEPRRH